MAILSFLQDDAFIFVITLATKAATGSQLGAGIRGNHHPGLISDFFFFHCSCDVISLAGNGISLKSTGGVNSTPYRAHVFLMHSCTVILSLT